jgi:Zn-dependent protease/CBS domain-containing protein
MFGERVRLGSPFGIAINVDLSWVVGFVLITWSLGGHYFPGRHPAWPASTYWGVAALTSVLFFTSVLLHELAHSLVARRCGIAVRDITLFIFGGVANLEHEPERPRDDLLIALAGPLASLGLATGFGALWWIVATAGTPLHALAGWLAVINLIMAVFNMLPGLPLDGGRVLRAALWSITGSVSRATRYAARAGQFLGLALMLWGVWQVFTGNSVSGIWVAVIGWFLYRTAVDSAAHAALEDVLAGHTASEIMMADCPRIARARTLDVVVDQVVPLSTRTCFPVVEDDRFYGLLTLAQIKAVARERRPFTRVIDVMSSRVELPVVRPDQPLMTVLDQFGATEAAQLPVLDDGRLVGMVTRENVVDFILARKQLVAAGPAL